MDSKQNIDDLVKNYRLPSAKTREQAWDELNSKLKKQNKKPGIKKWIFAAASVFVLMVLFGTIADNFLFIQKYSTDFNEQKTVLLPDQSEVKLSPNSRLIVNYGVLTGKRRLEFSGIGFFQINKGKKLTVKFGSGKITVLGTSFFVKSYNTIAPEIKCISGKVKIKAGSSAAVLEQGEGLVIEDGKKFKQIPVVEEQVLQEINGLYKWKNESLEHVFKNLEARYGYKVVSEETIKSRKFSGELDLKEMRTAIEIISVAMDLDYSIDHKNKMIRIEETE